MTGQWERPEEHCTSDTVNVVFYQAQNVVWSKAKDFCVMQKRLKTETQFGMKWINIICSCIHWRRTFFFFQKTTDWNDKEGEPDKIFREYSGSEHFAEMNKTSTNYKCGEKIRTEAFFFFFFGTRCLVSMSLLFCNETLCWRTFRQRKWNWKFPSTQQKQKSFLFYHWTRKTLLWKLVEHRNCGVK